MPNGPCVPGSRKLPSKGQSVSYFVVLSTRVKYFYSGNIEPTAVELKIIQLTRSVCVLPLEYHHHQVEPAGGIHVDRHPAKSHL